MYWTTRPGRGVLAHRWGSGSAIEPLDYGETHRFGDAVVSLHPADHVLGSVQVRNEARGEIWVNSGDYNGAADSEVRSGGRRQRPARK